MKLGFLFFVTVLFCNSAFSYPLIVHHAGCDSNGKGTDPACISAAYRYCSNEGKGNGVIQEEGVGTYAVACFQADQFTIVPINELTARNSGCNSVHKSQDSSCMSATHRACVARGFDGGTPQEVGVSDMSVACKNGEYTEIPTNELLARHSGCSSPSLSRTGACMAAIHRACNARGWAAGISQGIVGSSVSALCFDTSDYTEVSIL